MESLIFLALFIAFIIGIRIWSAGKIKKVRAKVEHLKTLLDSVKELPHVGEVRQAGMMIGIELVRDRDTREQYDPAEKVGMRVVEEARSRGMIIRPLGNVIVLMPHLTFTRPQLERMVEITRLSIEAVTGD